MNEDSNTTADTGFDPADIEKNKGMAILAYIIFFIPLIAAGDSKFAKFHGNQGLVLFIFGFGIQIVSVILYVIFIGFIIQPIGGILWLVWAIIGIVNASGGQAKPLPIIGGINIIKA